MRKHLQKILYQVEMITFVDFWVISLGTNAGPRPQNMVAEQLLVLEEYLDFIVVGRPKQGTRRVENWGEATLMGRYQLLDHPPILRMSIHRTDKGVEHQHLNEIL